MITNKLLLNIPDIQTSCVLRIEDISIYSEFMPYVNPLVKIKVPGFNDCVTISEVEKNFILNLSACALGLQTEDCGTEFNDIPDGVYVISYSQEPNDKLFVEYNHLRLTQINNDVKEKWCELRLSACEPIPEVAEKIKHLQFIQSLLDASKAKVEFCKEVEEGMVLYNYAKKLLSEFSCKIY